MKSSNNRPLLILGGGGHAKVLIDALKILQREMLGILDPALEVGAKISGIPVLGGDQAISNYPPNTVELVNAVGSDRCTKLRQSVFDRFQAMEYCFCQVIHPSAILAPDVQLSEGVQIMAGVVIQTGCRIGINTICNTRSSIDHDCQIGDHVHLASGVTLSGGVTVGNRTHIGTGSSIIQKIHIGKDTLVGAGSIVIHDIPESIVAFGVPARIVKVKERSL